MDNYYSHIICKEVSHHFPVSLASHCSVVHQKITPKGPIQDNRCPMPHKCILPYMKIAFTLYTISIEERLLFSPRLVFDQSWYVCHPLLALSKFTLCSIPSPTNFIWTSLVLVPLQQQQQLAQHDTHVLEHFYQTYNNSLVVWVSLRPPTSNDMPK